MRTTGAVSLFSVALALYVAPFVHAATPRSGAHAGRQLSDQNLFEVHLQQAAAGSHKRLPSDLLNHHERSEEEDTLPGQSETTTAPAVIVVEEPEADDPTAVPASTPDSDTSSQAAYSARQPSHFIKHFKHRSNKLGKRRLSVQPAAVHFERDTEDLDSSVWQVPALVARAFEVNAKLWQREPSNDASSASSTTSSTSQDTLTSTSSSSS